MAFGILFAAIKNLTRFGSALDNLTATNGAWHPNLLHNRLSIAAVGEIGAGQKFAKATFLDDHHGTAFFTLHVANLRRCRRQRRAFVLKALHILLKGVIELAQYLYPISLFFSNQVQVRLHGCRKRNADESLEILGQHIRGLVAQLRNQELFALLHHIATCNNGYDSGCIGGGTTNALFLKLLNQRGFSKMSRGLGKVLLRRHQLVQHQLLALLDIRHGFILFLIAELAVDGQKARETQHGACSAQLIIVCINEQCGHIVQCIAHLASHGPLPNQCIQLQLVHSEVFGNFFGSAQHAGGANSLVGVLSILFSTIMIGLGRTEFIAQIVLNVFTNLVDGHICQTHGVRSHVGDETHSGLAQAHTFVELLGHHHGLLRRKIQLFIGLLLQIGGGKGRHRMALALLALGLADNVLCLGQGSLCCMSLLSILQLQLFPLVLNSLRFKNRRLGSLPQLGI